MRKLVLLVVVLGVACGGGHKSVTPAGDKAAKKTTETKVEQQKPPPDDPPPPPPDNDVKTGNTTTSRPPDPKDLSVGMAIGGKLESGPPRDGGYDAREIAQVVQAHSRDAKKCYQDQLASDPNLAGKVVVRFQIGADGKVVTATVTSGMHPTVDGCLTRVINSLVFPPKGTITTVSFPFIFASG